MMCSLLRHSLAGQLRFGRCSVCILHFNKTFTLNKTKNNQKKRNKTLIDIYNILFCQVCAKYCCPWALRGLTVLIWGISGDLRPVYYWSKKKTTKAILNWCKNEWVHVGVLGRDRDVLCNYRTKLPPTGKTVPGRNWTWQRLASYTWPWSVNFATASRWIPVYCPVYRSRVLDTTRHTPTSAADSDIQWSRCAAPRTPDTVLPTSLTYSAFLGWTHSLPPKLGKKLVPALPF